MAEREGFRGPRVPIDDLVRELVDRADEVLDTHRRLRGLLDAVIGIATDLNLPDVLDRIVRAAAHLVDAHYAAVGVLRPDGGLADFVHTGVEPAVVADIGNLPNGRGVLGTLGHHGSPATHPPMHTFLSVPITLRGEVFGNLYLAEKAGGAEFTAQDEELVVALAAAAGVAIENAQLYEDSQRRQRWLEVTTDIATTLLGGTDRQQALDLIATGARQLTEADTAVVVLPDPDHGKLRVVAAAGAEAAALRGRHVDAIEPLIQAIMASGQAEIIDDLVTDARVGAPLDTWGPAMLVPLSSHGDVLGAIALAKHSGGPPFAASDPSSLNGFAAQAAIALELADARDNRERLAMLEDRDRIARDLHDLIIQRLFATGMGLQGTQRMVESPRTASRLGEAVAALDDTIREIRRTIFSLRTTEDSSNSPRRAVIDMIDGAIEVLGFEPTVTFTGPVDSAIPDAVTPHVPAVLREALTNIGRHAAATAAAVTLTVDGATVRLVVQDDGSGLPPHPTRSGLANLAKRAEDLGGALRLGTSQLGGAELVWEVPCEWC